MLCVQQNVLKYLGIFKRKNDYSTSFSIFKNNQDFSFQKERKKKPTQTNSNMLTFILTYDKPKILLQWHSIFSSRYMGVMGCLVVFQTEHLQLLSNQRNSNALWCKDCIYFTLPGSRSSGS